MCDIIAARFNTFITLLRNLLRVGGGGHFNSLKIVAIISATPARKVKHPVVNAAKLKSLRSGKRCVNKQPTHGAAMIRADPIVIFNVFMLPLVSSTTASSARP